MHAGRLLALDAGNTAHITEATEDFYWLPMSFATLHLQLTLYSVALCHIHTNIVVLHPLMLHEAAQACSS